MPENAAGVTAIAIGQTTFSYSFFLPSLREVRKATRADVAMRDDVILGQLAAASVSLSVGVMLAWQTDSSVPIVTALAIAVVIAVIYAIAMNDSGVIYSDD